MRNKNNDRLGREEAKTLAHINMIHSSIESLSWKNESLQKKNKIIVIYFFFTTWKGGTNDVDGIISPTTP